MSIDRAILFRLATNTRLERIVKTVPWGQDMAWRAASPYVAGTAADDAIRAAQELSARNVASSIDQFGELVDDPTVAQRVTDDYLRLAGQLTDSTTPGWRSTCPTSASISTRAAVPTASQRSRGPYRRVGASRSEPRTTHAQTPC